MHIYLETLQRQSCTALQIEGSSSTKSINQNSAEMNHLWSCHAICPPLPSPVNLFKTWAHSNHGMQGMPVDFSFFFHYAIKTSGLKFGWRQFSLRWSTRDLRGGERGRKGGGELKTWHFVFFHKYQKPRNFKRFKRHVRYYLNRCAVNNS